MLLLAIDLLFGSLVIHLIFSFATIYQVMEVWGIRFMCRLEMDVLQIFENI
jgi:hypothetical protein